VRFNERRCSQHGLSSVYCAQWLYYRLQRCDTDCMLISTAGCLLISTPNTHGGTLPSFSTALVKKLVLGPRYHAHWDGFSHMRPVRT
jgi:hypothetical protein